MISIIIPTYNEAEGIVALITHLQQHDRDKYVREIIVADGGSTDQTCALAAGAGARVVHSPGKGRAIQMNAGAATAQSELLYFIHADSYPPVNYSREIMDAVADGYRSGCYRLTFDDKHWFLQVNCWFTRFNINAFRFGDQSLFITRDIFTQLQGFRQDHVLMEDQEIIGRIRKLTKFRILPRCVTTSARKYRQNGIYRLQGIFFIIYLLYQLGFSQDQLVKVYRKLIRQDKV